MIVAPPPTRTAAPTGAPGNRYAAVRWRRLVPVLVLAWLLPLGTHATGTDVVLPLAVLAAVMVLQRGARGPVDRLVLALAQLFGACCVAGLVLSVWPWHLEPVPVAGVALTASGLLAAVTGRLGPVGPLRLPPVDRLVVAAVLAVGVVAVVPFAARDLGGRIGIPLTGEDIVRHFLLYDVIGRTGGYAFLHPDVLRPYLPDTLVRGVAGYPQGVHLTYAILDRFISSSAPNAGAAASMNVMVWLLVGTYLLFALAVLWSLRRVAGPVATVPRLLPVLALAATWLAFADPIAVLSRGFPNELVGLALNAVLTALAARPLSRRGEQTATVAALIIGVAFSYPLFLPYTAVVAVLWAWRCRLWRRRWAWACAPAVAALAAVNPLAALAGSRGDQLLLPGTALVVDRPATLVLVAVAVCGLVARRGLRSPARHATLFALSSASGFAAAVAAYQIAILGHTVYYFDKLLHLLIVVALTVAGGLTRLMPAGRPPGAGPPAYLRGLVPGVALVMPAVLALVLLGGPWHGTLGSPGLRLATGRDRGSPDGARDALLMTRGYPDGGDAINVDLMGGPWRNWYATLLASTMQGTYRYEPDWYLFLYPKGRPKTIADLDALVASSPVPVRFFVFNPAASMLVLDSTHPHRPWQVPGAIYPVAAGDPGAPTDVQAARQLAAKYPDKVQVVFATPPNP